MQPIYLLSLGLPLSDGGWPCAHPILQKADVIVGGRSQLAALQNHPAEKLLVDANIDALYQRMQALRAEGKSLAVLCSGDSLYFGLGARLAERFGASAIKALPGLSSMQAAASFLGLPWEDMRSASLHGRKNMLPLAHALMAAGPVCLLCDAAASPAFIASWMLERGCGAYDMHLLDDLRATDWGEVAPQAYAKLALEEAAAMPESEAAPVRRLVVLQPRRVMNEKSGQQSQTPLRPFGIDDSAIASDRGVFTKQPVRAAGLAALGVAADDAVWDIGAGSGAVSIEAARLAHRGQVVAIEASQDRLARLLANRRKFGAPNLEIVSGSFPQCLRGLREAQEFPRPDKIFVGGGLGGSADSARELLLRAWDELLPGGALLAHCVLLSSLELARAVLAELAGEVRIQSVQAAQSACVGKDVQLKAMNPVFLLSARKNG